MFLRSKKNFEIFLQNYKYIIADFEVVLNQAGVFIPLSELLFAHFIRRVSLAKMQELGILKKYRDDKHLVFSLKDFLI